MRRARTSHASSSSGETRAVHEASKSGSGRPTGGSGGINTVPSLVPRRCTGIGVSAIRCTRHIHSRGAASGCACIERLPDGSSGVLPANRRKVGAGASLTCAALEPGMALETTAATSRAPQTDRGQSRAPASNPFSCRTTWKSLPASCGPGSSRPLRIRTPMDYPATNCCATALQDGKCCLQRVASPVHAKRSMRASVGLGSTPPGTP
jgi:hypothetical protein